MKSDSIRKIANVIKSDSQWKSDKDVKIAFNNMLDDIKDLADKTFKVKSSKDLLYIIKGPMKTELERFVDKLEQYEVSK